MFYEKVKELCEKKGVSIAQLEREAGIGNGSIGRWNTDRERPSNPNVKTIERIAKYFEISVAELIDE